MILLLPCILLHCDILHFPLLLYNTFDQVQFKVMNVLQCKTNTLLEEYTSNYFTISLYRYVI